MDLEGVMLSEISQTEGETLYDFTHMWNIKKLLNKSKHVDTENRVVVTRGEGTGEQGV